MSRTWVNGGPPFLNAANLNALETDVTTALGVPDAALATRVVTGATATALNATYVPKWKAATAYLAGDAVLSPAGDTVTAIANFTSGASFNAANWNYSPTYVPVAGAAIRRALGKRWAFLGDSITNGSSASVGNDYISMVNMLAGRGVIPIVRAGVPGNNSSQMLARFDADIAGHGADTLHLLAGTNDAGQAVAVAAFAANIRALVAKARNLGMAVIIGTIPPRGPGATAAVKKATFVNNLWLNRFCAAENIPLVDYFSALVDPTTGNYLTANNSGDDVHPNDNGHYAMATALANALTTITTNGSLPLPYLATTDGDPTNLIASPMMAGTPGNVSPTTGWWHTGGTGTTSVLANDASIVGQYYSVAQTAANSYHYIYTANMATTALSGGDLVAYCFKFFNDQLTQPALADVKNKFSIQFQTSGAVAVGAAYQVFNGNRPLNGAPSYTEIVVPATSGMAECRFELSTTATSTAQSRLKIAQVGMFNLTQLGLIGI